MSEPAGQFMLSAPSKNRDPRTTPVRGDLAHIALAGKVFVPHYAVPQPRPLKAGGANLRILPKPDAEVLETLAAGSMFDVLDLSGSWAWGQAPTGCVGYVEIAALGPPE